LFDIRYNHLKNKRVLDETDDGKSLMNTRKSSGPRTDNRHLTRNLTIKNYLLFPIVKESRDPIPDVSPDAVIV
jgi:hypothetical protein